MVRALFIFPPSRSDYRFRFHLGVGYIQAFLRNKGISSSQYAPRKNVTLRSMVEDILRQKPDVVGFTCYDSNYYIIKSIAKVVKKKKPDIPIVVGGPTATFSDEFVLKDCPDIDVCVRGEGEQTVYELLEADLTNLEKIHGVTFRRRESIVQVKDRQLIRGDNNGAELDILPSPYLEGIAPLDGSSGVLTSRGCVYHCTFCNFSAMSRHMVRYHSVGRVIDELRMVDDYVAKVFSVLQKPLVQFNDDTFSLNTERAKEICKRIIDEKISLRFYADTRADFCDAELLKLMFEAGFREINFGLESAVPRVLRNIKKIYSGNRDDFLPEERFLRTLRENVGLAKKLGFHVSTSIILGLPGETPEDGEETLRFVKELGVDEYSHNFLKIHSGTELFDTCKNHNLGLKKSSTILPYQTIYCYDVYALEPLPNAALHTSIIEDEANYLELIANNLNWSEGRKWLSLIITDMIKDKTVLLRLSDLATLPFSLYFNNIDYLQTAETANQYIEELVEQGLTLGNFYFTKSVHSREKGKKAYHLVRSGESQWPRSLFFEIPFSKYENLPVPLQNAKLIFSIQNKGDLNAVIRLMEKSASSDSIEIVQPYPPSCIKDECKWAGEPCPAIDLSRLILLPDFSIVTCFQGNPIGGLNSSYEKMKASLEHIREREHSRRACVACPVKDNCSKCLFPSPLLAKEYCNLRRAHPEIADVVSLFRAMRILTRDGGLLTKRKIGRLSKASKHRKNEKLNKIRVKKEIELIYADRSPYVVDLRTRKVFSLNKFTARILKNMICGSDLKNADYLQVRSGEERSRLVRSVAKALKIFEEKGFLESDGQKPHRLLAKPDLRST